MGALYGAIMGFVLSMICMITFVAWPIGHAFLSLTGIEGLAIPTGMAVIWIGTIIASSIGGILDAYSY